MRNIVAVLLVSLILKDSQVQSQSLSMQRPRLVVGIVVDQMRWDYLYRYYDRYAEKGVFKRLMGQGFCCENTMIPYIHTVTACGHASMYAGTVPAIHGVTGNEWWDHELNDYRYCTNDTSAKTVGSSTAAAGAMSPRKDGQSTKDHHKDKKEKENDKLLRKEKEELTEARLKLTHCRLVGFWLTLVVSSLGFLLSLYNLYLIMQGRK